MMNTYHMIHHAKQVSITSTKEKFVDLITNISLFNIGLLLEDLGCLGHFPFYHVIKNIPIKSESKNKIDQNKSRQRKT